MISCCYDLKGGARGVAGLAGIAWFRGALRGGHCFDGPPGCSHPAKLAAHGEHDRFIDALVWLNRQLTGKPARPRSTRLSPRGLERPRIPEQSNRPAGVQEHHRLALPEFALPDQVDHPGHGLPGINRVERNPLQPGRAFAPLRSSPRSGCHSLRPHNRSSPPPPNEEVHRARRRNPRSPWRDGKRSPPAGRAAAGRRCQAPGSPAFSPSSPTTRPACVPALPVAVTSRSILKPSSSACRTSSWAHDT